jgi:arylsulfatase A-like enzyme
MDNKKPNLLFVFSDQQHHQALGCVDDFFVTPNWDRFAGQAARFTTAYCTTPLCSPSRASLLTGLMPPASTVLDNGQPLKLATIAPALQAAGYQTAYVGKWHLKEEPVATAGWDYAQGVYDEYTPPNRPLGDDETLAYALDYLRGVDTSDKPFALFVSFDQPHGVYWAQKPESAYPADFMSEPPADENTPLPDSWHNHDPASAPVDMTGAVAHQRPAQYAAVMGEDRRQWQRYREVYRACVEDYDRLVGSVLDEVESRGFWESTVTVLTSDHGDMDTHHRLCFKGPFPYEQIQRVPLAIRVPQRWGGQAPCVRDDLVSLVDLPHTLCDAAGANPPHAGHSISLWPLLTGQADRHTRDHALIRYPHPVLRTVREGDWKYTRHPGLGEFLYNLADDPEELTNRAGDPDTAGPRARLAKIIDTAGSGDSTTEP